MRAGRTFPIRPRIGRSRELRPQTISDATAAAVSAGTLAVTAPTKIALNASSGFSSASLALGAGGTQTLTLSASTGLSGASLALTAPTFIPLDPSVAISRTVMELANRTISIVRASERELVSVGGEEFAVDRARALDADT